MDNEEKTLIYMKIQKEDTILFIRVNYIIIWWKSNSSFGNFSGCPNRLTNKNLK